MEFFIVAAVVVLILALLFLLSIKPAKIPLDKLAVFEKYDYAHRGLHSEDKSIPENSMEAIRQAVRHGYGMEYDIQLSKDGQVVVFHDDTLKRVCGVNKRVDALTLEELRLLSLEATDQRIPLFTDVLAEVRGKTPMIIELKTCARPEELCEKALNILRTYKGLYCIESFDPKIVRWFYKNAPDIVRGQLSSRYRANSGKGPLARFCLTNLMVNFWAKPQFIAYNHRDVDTLGFRICHKLYHACTVAWTVRDADNWDRIKDAFDLVIFEFRLP